MYYFFLGRFLSRNSEDYIKEIRKISNESYLRSNYLILLFLIHHTDDRDIIDDILISNMLTFDNVDPAQLNPAETRKFAQIVSSLPESILSNRSVESERAREKSVRDKYDQDEPNQDSSEQAQFEDPINDLYRIFKNNAILGQVLRNKYGILQKERIEEIAETIADGGLRVVNILLRDENEIEELAHFIQEQIRDHVSDHVSKKRPMREADEIAKIRKVLRWLSFLWTMANIEKIVSCLNHPEIREIVSKVANQKSTPAYDLINYFSELDSASELNWNIRNSLENLIKKHRDPFIKSVLSIRTQHYLNTHRSPLKIEQSICSLLKIDYPSRYLIER